MRTDYAAPDADAASGSANVFSLFTWQAIATTASIVAGTTADARKPNSTDSIDSQAGCRTVQSQ